MTVHVFGNSPLPMVAIHGLHQSVQVSGLQIDPDVQRFVMRDFYVDDGSKSLPTVKAAINLLKQTLFQDILSKSNLSRKIATNNKEVMEDFPTEDRAMDLKDLDLNAEALPMQCSLGINRDLQTNCFHFSVSDEMKPYTCLL